MPVRHSRTDKGRWGLGDQHELKRCVIRINQPCSGITCGMSNENILTLHQVDRARADFALQRLRSISFASKTGSRNGLKGRNESCPGCQPKKRLRSSKSLE